MIEPFSKSRLIVNQGDWVTLSLEYETRKRHINLHMVLKGKGVRSQQKVCQDTQCVPLAQDTIVKLMKRMKVCQGDKLVVEVRDQLESMGQSTSDRMIRLRNIGTNKTIV